MAGSGKPETNTPVEDAPVLDGSGFHTESITVRGKTYTFRELSAGDYNDLIDIYTKDDIVDSVGVTRSMAVRSLTAPVLTNDELMALPFPVYSRLIGVVNKMHFSPEAEGEAPNA